MYEYSEISKAIDNKQYATAKYLAEIEAYRKNPPRRGTGDYPKEITQLHKESWDEQGKWSFHPQTKSNTQY